MANTILERIQERYPVLTGDARNIAEALGMLYGTGGRGSGAIKDVLYKDIALTFDPNGGTGDPFIVKIPKSSAQWKVPDCPFTPPEGKDFHYWYYIDSGTDVESQRFYPGISEGGISDDFTLYAIWKDAE